MSVGLLERFRSIDDGSAGHYRTAYARLSSAVHMDAEATLLQLFSVGFRDELGEGVELLGIEVISFVRYMFRYALWMFVMAALEYATTFEMKAQIVRLSELMVEVSQQLLSASSLLSNPGEAYELMKKGVYEWPDLE